MCPTMGWKQSRGKGEPLRRAGGGNMEEDCNREGCDPQTSHLLPKKNSWESRRASSERGEGRALEAKNP